MILRLQKYLAHAGVCSRRKAEEHILNGRIKVNGSIVAELGTKVSPGKDIVLFDNQKIVLKETAPKIYIILNKPKGYITSCSQKKSKIILDLIDISERIYPVGRLDKDSTGLVILTNDGPLHNRLSHPSFSHEKEYIVKTANPVKEADLKRLAKGVDIDGIKTRKAQVKQLEKNQFKIILKEGRNRQIRKMVGKINNRIVHLKRIRMANIRLGNLKEGTWRYLTKKEISKLTQ
ncbi:MAG: rRNA pseudouridine synthase [Desulfobacteraceae bacterium]|nr:rRNA pseudouridine synthase [Desulfobacteraceae bacterium]